MYKSCFIVGRRVKELNINFSKLLGFIFFVFAWYFAQVFSIFNEKLLKNDQNIFRPDVLKSPSLHKITQDFLHVIKSYKM